MGGGGGGRCNGNMCPEIPSRLRHFPPQKQKVVPCYSVLVLPPQFRHSAPVPFMHVSLSFCRVNLWGTILRDCVLDKKYLKLELRLFISLSPGEAEIGMNCSCHVLLHNSWVEITMKCFAEILKISRENVHCKIQFRALTNAEYRKKRPSGPLRTFHFFFPLLQFCFLINYSL